MGTPFAVTVSGETSLAAKAVDAAFQEVSRLEDLLSIYQTESPLSRFNQAFVRGLFPNGPEILQVVSSALHYAETSNGAFDPTTGPLIDLWGFGTLGEKGTPPSGKVLDHALQSVGYQHLKVHPESGSLDRQREGVTLNLGAIAKGYAIDRAVRILKEHKIRRGLVSFGSTLYGFGAPAWKVSIQHPRDEDKILATVSLSEQALATSGDYERCFFYQGKRFSHIIDPRSGYPVFGMASVSVLAPTAMAADALSTTAFVLGPEEGQRYVEGVADASALIVPETQLGEITLHRTARWPEASNSIPIARRRFLALLGIGFSGLFFPRLAEARTTRFATEKEVLLKTLPEAKEFVVAKVKLTSEQLQRAQELAGKRFRKRKYLFLVGKNGDEPVGYAIRLDVTGKKRPITFMVIIEPDGKIRAIEVLLYRESKGSQVRYSRFMEQFHQKTKDDPLRLGQDIRPINGATLSSRATAYVARKALAIFEVAFKSGGSD